MANERWPAGPPSEAPTTKLVPDSISDGDPIRESLSRLETILDHILRNLAPVVGAR